MGVSGASRDIGWYSFNNNGIHTPTYQRQLGGNNIAVTPTIFELAYQVRGEEQITSAVPEPETYALMLAGLGLVGFMARRRKQAEA